MSEWKIIWVEEDMGRGEPRWVQCCREGRRWKKAWGDTWLGSMSMAEGISIFFLVKSW